MTSDFEGFSIPDFIHYIYYPILILEKEPVFPFLMFNVKQGNYWYHFYNAFGMTQSLTGDWTRTQPLGYQGGGTKVVKIEIILTPRLSNNKVIISSQ